MGNFAQFAAQKAVPAATKVAGATTPAPVARPSTAIVPKKTAPAAPAPAAKTAPAAPAAPASAAPAPVTEEPGGLRQVGLTQWLMDQPTAPAAAAPTPVADLPLVVSEAGAGAYRADEAKRLRQEENAYYAKKLDEVARLRKANVIGAVNVGPSWAAPESAPLIGSASMPRPATGKPGMPGVEVFPRPENVYTPNEDTLASVGRFAAEAKRLGQEYRAADRDVARGAEAIEQARNDWQFDRRKLPQMALAQRERVRRLAERRASLREMGFTNDTEMDEKFLK